MEVGRIGITQHLMLSKMQAHSDIAANAIQSQRELNGIDFGKLIQRGIEQVDQMQTNSARMTRDYDLGLTDDLVAATIASHKASLSFSALVQVRNKMVSNFDEIMKMPI